MLVFMDTQLSTCTEGLQLSCGFVMVMSWVNIIVQLLISIRDVGNV